jgi:hypothetical protein
LHERRKVPNASNRTASKKFDVRESNFVTAVDVECKTAGCCAAGCEVQLLSVDGQRTVCARRNSDTAEVNVPDRSLELASTPISGDVGAMDMHSKLRRYAKDSEFRKQSLKQSRGTTNRIAKWAPNAGDRSRKACCVGP